MTQQKLTTVSVSSAKTASGQSNAAAVVGSTVAILIDCTASSGTPSMTVSAEWSHDGSTWFTGDAADSMTAITGATKKVKSFTAKAPYVRAAWAMSGGSPSLTFAAYIFSIM